MVSTQATPLNHQRTEPLGDQSASGPGRLSRAFAVDRSHTGIDMTAPSSPLWIEEGEPISNRQAKRTPRIGVDYAGSWAKKNYRFVIAGHPAASGLKSLR